MGLQTEASSFDAEVHGLVMSGQSSQAAERMLSRLASELRAFLHRLLGAVSLADEALGATCEQLSRGLSSFHWQCSLRAWSYIVARREAKRCRIRYAQVATSGATLASAPDPRKGTTFAASSSSTSSDMLDRLRSSLSDDDRDLLVLRIERGLVWKEIAAAFLEENEVNPDAIQAEVARLRLRFRAIREKVAAALAMRAECERFAPGTQLLSVGD